MNRPPCSAVVFDLDGTLLDSLADIAHAANEALRDLGVAEHPVDRYRFLVGDGVVTLFERALPDDRRDPDTVARCVRRFHETYDRHWNRLSTLYPGVPELLDRLVERGVRFAVLSNKPQAFTQKCVAHFLADWPVEPVLGQRDGVPRKPDPAGAVEIARHWNLPAAACLYLGDTSVDMQTARGAEMFAVGALWGFRPREELLAHGAETLVEHPTDLLRWLAP